MDLDVSLPQSDNLIHRLTLINIMSYHKFQSMMAKLFHGHHDRHVMLIRQQFSEIG